MSNRKTPFLKEMPLLLYGLSGAPSLTTSDPATAVLLSVIAEDYISNLIAVAHGLSTDPKPSVGASTAAPTPSKRLKVIHSTDVLSAVSSDPSLHSLGTSFLSNSLELSSALQASSGVAKHLYEEGGGEEGGGRGKALMDGKGAGDKEQKGGRQEQAAKKKKNGGD